MDCLRIYLKKNYPFFRKVYRIAKSDYGIRHACLFLRMHVTTRIPLA